MGSCQTRTPRRIQVALAVLTMITAALLSADLFPYGPLPGLLLWPLLAAFYPVNLLCLILLVKYSAPPRVRGLGLAAVLLNLSWALADSQKLASLLLFCATGMFLAATILLFRHDRPTEGRLRDRC